MALLVLPKGVLSAIGGEVKPNGPVIINGKVVTTNEN